MSLVFIKSLDIKLSGKEILTDINLNIEKGGMTFLIGKTGSGKTTLIKSFYGDISINSSERFEIAGFNLKEIRDYQIPFLRRKIGIVFQDFKLLDDRSIYNNLEFVLKATGWLDNKKIEDRILEVLNMVGVEINLDTYPSKLSGGEQQRVAIARALLNNPELIIADEPTAGLDVTISRQILDVMRDLVRDFDSSLILVSRDLGVVAHYCERVAVMYKGRVLEVADIASFFEGPGHRYSRHLILASQASRDSALSENLSTEQRSASSTNGCVYYPRCPVSIDRCQSETPKEEKLSKTHLAACFRSSEVASGLTLK